MTKTRMLARISALFLLLTLLLGACGGPKEMLGVGDSAPSSLALSDQHGQQRTLGEFRGQGLVVYFYPKNNTPGCTAEACAFRDVWGRFEQAQITVIGVSTDDAQAHAAFAEEHELPFTLLADTDAKLLKAFGAKPRLGFAPRISFLIDEEGVIQATYPKVDPGVHASEILDDAARLGIGAPEQL